MLSLSFFLKGLSQTATCVCFFSFCGKLARSSASEAKFILLGGFAGAAYVGKKPASHQPKTGQSFGNNGRTLNWIITLRLLSHHSANKHARGRISPIHLKSHKRWLCAAIIVCVKWRNAQCQTTQKAKMQRRWRSAGCIMKSHTKRQLKIPNVCEMCYAAGNELYLSAFMATKERLLWKFQLDKAFI